jgi:rRNA biogenesis protein RRP5
LLSLNRYPVGKFVNCCILSVDNESSLLDVSLRPSRISTNNPDDDTVQQPNDIVQGYVSVTNRHGCFVQLSRKVTARVLLKELCDGYLPVPQESFPTGRLVIGKVKEVNDIEQQQENDEKNGPLVGYATRVTLDMRESILARADEKSIQFDTIEIGNKYKGTIHRIEQYGVFVRINDTNISGLAHLSECSDDYIKKLTDLYEVGDLVKVMVIKKDTAKRQVGFSLKASHFIDDADSVGSDDTESDIDDNDDEEEENGSAEGDENDDDESDASDDEVEVMDTDKVESETDGDDSAGEANRDSDESHDEDSNLAEESDDDDDDSVRTSADSSVEEEINEPKSKKQNFDTDVGFDWGDQSAAIGETNITKQDSDDEDDDSDSDSEDEENDDDEGNKTSHKARKKIAQRRREEQEIMKREIALADGTADENPETVQDFERLLAGEPNSSELWIRYMAFHLTLANVQAARDVAHRAFARIDFRQEVEKLNVWCALLTLEFKYGTDETFQNAIDRACQQNNPKKVYLRVCEIATPRDDSLVLVEATRKADALYNKMCKKFRDKKKVWLAHIEYLLKANRSDEAYALSKRALLSLPKYKHLETMSKFAQLEFEYGTADRARTLFDGLLKRYPKRLDILFVYTDKEIKFGTIESTRSLFEGVANPDDQRLSLKLSDKQMKSFFKKWFSFEQDHGTDETQEHVKDVARDFVQRKIG